MEELEKFSHN